MEPHAPGTVFFPGVSRGQTPPGVHDVRARALIIAMSVAMSVAWAGPLLAAPAAGEPRHEGDVTCPPDVKGEPPTVGRGGSKSLSEELADSRGVICPPSGLDRDMQVTPPGGGHLKIIPPPGSPGGDQSVLPK
jgi:hypothetical protein